MINFDALLTHLKTDFSKLIFLSAFLLAFSLQSAAQTDSTETELKVERGRVEGEVEAVTRESIEKIHSPKKATIMSAVLPGLGQVYNKKYWKVPIIYGGFAVAGYFVQWNLSEIDRFKELYALNTDTDPTNDSDLPNDFLLDAISEHKTWRDLSYISLAAIYILNIIDANVDAHLFYFDVGEDLTMNIQPFVNPSQLPSAGLTLSLKL
jgi:hypothetical protein